MNQLIKAEHLTRQADIIPLDVVESTDVTIVGCGAIGSFSALSLAKMGVLKIKVYDFDNVDIVNMNNQFFRFKDIGKNKASALRELVHDFTGVDIVAIPEKCTDETVVNCKIVVMSVDSMAVRAELFKSVSCDFLIDTRMGAEVYNQYVVNMNNQKSRSDYEKTLFSDSEAVQERCTAKSTIYTALTASSMVCKAVKNIVVSEKYPKSIMMNLQKSSNNVMMFEG